MTNYEKGRAFEYEVIKLFESAGYIVSRSVSSKSTWDFHAHKVTAQNNKEVWCRILYDPEKDHGVVLGQTKRNKVRTPKKGCRTAQVGNDTKLKTVCPSRATTAGESGPTKEG